MPLIGAVVEMFMRVDQRHGDDGSLQVQLLDEGGEPVEVVSGFLRFLSARDCSPNTLVSYAYDLRHLWRFFAEHGLSWDRFGRRTRSHCSSTCDRFRPGDRGGA